MWRDYDGLRDRDKLSQMLMQGYTRIEIAKITGSSKGMVDRAVINQNLAFLAPRRCKKCLYFEVGEFGTGFCVVNGRVVSAMAFCKAWSERMK